jgi:tetratricopeptide (TPR) repeat protein
VPPRRLLPAAVLALGAGLLAQQGKQAPPSPEPPEEDEALVAKEYAFNPIQAAKELKVGDFYFKKGSYPAAIGRYKEALKWNPGFADAWRRIGDAQEKRKDLAGAREAWAKYLQLEPEGKYAAEIRKKLPGKP